VRLIAAPVSFLVLALALGSQLGAESPGTTSESEPARVVFVCEHGSVKSLVAAVYFNRRAEPRGLSFRAVARGVAPDSSVPAPVREGLRTDGFPVSDFVPQLLMASDVAHAWLVVSFDQDVTKVVESTRYLKWDGLPGVLADYPRGRDAIVRRVDALVDELARTPSP
jgi:hypothetical protein